MCIRRHGVSLPHLGTAGAVTNPRAIQPSLNELFVAPTDRVVPVWPKRRNTLEALALIQPDGGALMDASLHTKYVGRW
jgi:hypothetical protein